MSTSTTFIDLRVNNAEQLKESLSEPASSNIYLTFGKTDPWVSDATPNAANSSVATKYELWRNMIGGKRVVGSEASHMIPRVNWSEGAIYTSYDHMSDSLFNDPSFYVMNSDYSVYKCISNNYSSPSFVEPTSINPQGLTITADNYIWKYMYTVSDGDVLKFMTDDYIPIKTVALNDGSAQWQVQNNAVDGAISFIEVTDRGSGYTNVANLVVTVTGDGSGALVSANLVNSGPLQGKIDRIFVINPGTGYTYADVEISKIGGPGEGAKARAIISPPGGHGKDALYELGGKNIMFNIRLKSSENDILPTTNDFRQISIIKDPKVYQSNDILSDVAFLQAFTITVFGSGDYVEDEIVYQGPSLDRATFSAKVVSWDPVFGRLLLINTKGSPSFQSLVGTTYSTTRTVTDIQRGRLEPHTGKIMYVDNIKPITRSPDQTESFKILVKF